MAATIPVHFVRAALRGVVRQGLDPAPLLADAGVPAALLEDGRARVTPEQYSRLVQRVWDALDDEYLGLGPGRSPRGTFAMMCLATVHCADLRGAVERAVAFYRLFDASPGISLRAGELDGRAVARLGLDQQRLADDPDHLLAESLLVIWHRWSSWLVGRRLAVRAASFAYPAPPHAADYGPLFGVEPAFDAGTTSLALDAAALDLPVVQDEASLRRFLRRAPADLLVRPEDAPSTAQRVRRVLDRASADDDLGLDAVAARLLVSGPTLRRRLAQEGTSFQALKDAVRRDRAIVLLSRGDLPVEEVAARLGFSEASAFSRAFRRWTGAPPGAYRAATSASGSGSRTA